MVIIDGKICQTLHAIYQVSKSQERMVVELIAPNELHDYRISANSLRGNYSFLNFFLCTVTFGNST